MGWGSWAAAGLKRRGWLLPVTLFESNLVSLVWEGHRAGVMGSAFCTRDGCLIDLLIGFLFDSPERQSYYRSIAISVSSRIPKIGSRQTQPSHAKRSF